MFENPNFDHYTFEDIPLERDIFVISEKWMRPYDEMMRRFFDRVPGSEYEHVGFISWASVRSISPHSLELCWFADINKRHHQISVTLPRSEFIACIGCWSASERPRIFVKDSWLDHIHLRNYSIFGLIDAIGIRQRIADGSLTMELLLNLRQRIDELASRYLNVSFISFGDSLLLKSNWTVGMFDSDVKYTYDPEIFIFLFKEVVTIYKDVLGMSVYGVITQGDNHYYGSPHLHHSESGNHICMNCLGMPFERLFAIDEAARNAIRNKIHQRSDLYLDEEYFISLHLSYEFRKSYSPVRSSYKSKMSDLPKEYIPISCEELIGHIQLNDP